MTTDLKPVVFAQAIPCESRYESLLTRQAYGVPAFYRNTLT